MLREVEEINAILQRHSESEPLDNAIIEEVWRGLKTHMKTLENTSMINEYHPARYYLENFNPETDNDTDQVGCGARKRKSNESVKSNMRTRKRVSQNTVAAVSSNHPPTYSDAHFITPACQGTNHTYEARAIITDKPISSLIFCLKSFKHFSKILKSKFKILSHGQKL